MTNTEGNCENAAEASRQLHIILTNTEGNSENAAEASGELHNALTNTEGNCENAAEAGGELDIVLTNTEGNCENTVNETGKRGREYQLLDGDAVVAIGHEIPDQALLCPPHWGVDILFLLFPPSAIRRPASHLVSRHFRQQFLSYLYQIWHAGLLG